MTYTSSPDLFNFWKRTLKASYEQLQQKRLDHFVYLGELEEIPSQFQDGWKTV